MHRSTHPTRPRLAAGLAVGLGTAALVLAAPVAASAHVHVTPTSTEAGATSELGFSFSHGCDGSPTTAVEVTVPDEVSAVALIANPGWEVVSELVDGARTVVFTADKPVPDGVRETLEVEVTLPEDAADGTVLAFPALQVCETGETLWGDLEAEAESPAPTIMIGETADAPGHGDDAASTDAGAAEDAGSHDADAASTDASAAGGADTRDADAQAGQASEGGLAMPLAITALVVSLVAAALAAVAFARRRPTA